MITIRIRHVFNSYSDNELKEIISYMKKREFEEGDVVYKDKEEIDFCIVESGKFLLEGCTVDPYPNYFGEEAL